MFSINFGEIDLDQLVDEAFDEIRETDELVIPMGGFDVGDRVVCKVRNKCLAARHERADDRITLTIICNCFIDDETTEYIAYVPNDELSYLTSDGTYSVTPKVADLYGIHRKYIGERAITLRKNNIFKVAFRADGMSCVKCDEFFDKAEPNQEDGTLVCYLCRQNPYR